MKKEEYTLFVTIGDVKEFLSKNKNKKPHAFLGGRQLQWSPAGCKPTGPYQEGCHGLHSASLQKGVSVSQLAPHIPSFFGAWGGFRKTAPMQGLLSLHSLEVRENTADGELIHTASNISRSFCSPIQLWWNSNVMMLYMRVWYLQVIPQDLVSFHSQGLNERGLT